MIDLTPFEKALNTLDEIIHLEYKEYKFKTIIKTINGIARIIL